MSRKWYKKGILKLGTNVVISDPLYKPDANCAAVVKNMVPGTYICKVQISDEKYWGGWISAIRLTLKGCAKKKAFRKKVISGISVELGQCGFYDETFFRDINSKRSEESNDTEWNHWFRRVCDTTYRENEGFLAGIVDEKCFVSDSDDGVFTCYAKENEEGNVYDLWLKYI
jgi:hypothetical protein